MSGVPPVPAVPAEYPTSAKFTDGYRPVAPSAGATGDASGVLANTLVRSVRLARVPRRLPTSPPVKMVLLLHLLRLVTPTLRLTGCWPALAPVAPSVARAALVVVLNLFLLPLPTRIARQRTQFRAKASSRRPPQRHRVRLQVLQAQRVESLVWHGRSLRAACVVMTMTPSPNQPKQTV